MERSQFIVFQHRHTMAVGGDSELDRLCSEIGQNCLEVGMHPVLARPEVDGADGQSFHHGLHLIQRKAVGAAGIAVAEGAREVAFVGKAKSERNTGIRRLRERAGKR